MTKIYRIYLTNKLSSSMLLSLLKENTSFFRLLKLIISVLVFNVNIWQLCRLNSTKSSKFIKSSDWTSNSISFFNMVSVLLLLLFRSDDIDDDWDELIGSLDLSSGDDDLLDSSVL